MNIKKYFKVWQITTLSATQIAFASRFGALMFTVGKLLRFAFFLFFLIIIATRTEGVAGYSLWQVVFFYATFNFIDTTAQFFLRQVYRFRWDVVSGNFDYFLTRPISPLFRSLFGGSDILDTSMLVIAVIFIAVSAARIGNINLTGIFLYLVLIVNALLIALSIHILVLCIGVLTTEIDNSIMLYRDLTQMGRVPIDIYREPVTFLITFVIPVGIMMTYPAKALMNQLSAQFVIIAFVIGGLFLAGSLKLWRLSLKNYTSVST